MASLTCRFLALFLLCEGPLGKRYWQHDIKAAVWASPLWVDGKIYVPTEDGEVWIFRHGKGKQEPKRIDMESPLRTAPVFANGVLYVAAESKLYATQETK